MPLRRALAAAATTPLLLLAAVACATTPTTVIEPGTGPAADVAVTTSPSSSPTTGDEDMSLQDARNIVCPIYDESDPEWDEYDCDLADPASTDEPTEEPSEEPADETANFTESYTYEDDVEVEVTKIEHGEVTGADAEYSDELEKGDEWVKLTTRVKNNSDVRLDAYSSYTLTYGHDGEEAETAYLDEVETTTISGKILPGKSKVSSEVFLVPAKFQEDVVVEFNFDYEHESAIFAGSLK